jgi:hypothetical protein
MNHFVNEPLQNPGSFAELSVAMSYKKVFKNVQNFMQYLLNCRKHLVSLFHLL